MNKLDIKQLATIAGKVAVLYGGTSAEREISLLSGQAVISGLRSAGVQVVPVDVGRELVPQLLEIRPDRVFNMLHGRGGEDGVVQGLLETLRIPYSGSGVLGSALSMDKMKSKLLWQGLGISTAQFVMLESGSDWAALSRQYGRLVVKPVNEGSSIGMTITDSAAELEGAYLEARKFDSVVLAERYIDGEEFTVSILGKQVLPAIQLGTDNKFYDFNAKYIADDTRYLCPVELETQALEQLNRLAMEAFNSLGCLGWGRVDIMRDKQGCFYVLEVNTVPGMTSHSLVPMAAKAAGLSFEELLMNILFAKETDLQLERV